MARTIHDTWGVAHRARQADWSDPAIPKAIAKEMRKNWLRQQSIREGERRLRRQGALPPQPVHPMRVPIVVEHEAPYLFHAATEEDIRNVLRRLPPGSLDGLRGIRWAGRTRPAPYDAAKLCQLEASAFTKEWAQRIRATTPR